MSSCAKQATREQHQQLEVVLKFYFFEDDKNSGKRATQSFYMKLQVFMMSEISLTAMYIYAQCLVAKSLRETFAPMQSHSHIFIKVFF